MASNFVNGINILDTTNSSGINSGGSLNVRGGASFSKDIYIGGGVNISGTTTAFSDNIILINQNPINSTDTGFLFERFSEDILNNKKYSGIIYSETNDQYVFAYLQNDPQRGSITTNGFIGIQSENLTLNSTQNSSGLGTGGSLNVLGGGSISKDLHIGGIIYNNGNIIGPAGDSQWGLNNSNIYYTTGNVGIGTTSPATKLDVNGTINATTFTGGSVSVSNITSGTIITTNEISTNITSATINVSTGITSGSSQFTSLFVTGGSLNVSFNSNTLGSIITTGGNIGIGTSNPSQKLDITGNIRLKFDSSNNDGFTHFGSNNTTHLISLTRQGNSAAISGYDGIKFYVNSQTAPNSGTEVMFITSSGNVGIGTTSPSTGFGGTINNVKLALRNGTPGQENGTSTILIGGDANHYSSITSEHIGSGLTYLSFGTCTTNTNPTEKMRITASGNIGIGTSNPSYTLDILNSTQSANKPFLRLTGGGGPSNKVGIIIQPYNGRTGGPCSQIIAIDDGNASSHLTFYTAPTTSASTSVERMRITNSGNVGIGTSSPTTKLHLYNSGTSQVAIDAPASEQSLVSFYSAGSRKGTWYREANSDSVSFYSDVSSKVLMTFNTAGNVGIGTTSPNTKLEIRGGISNNNNYFVPESILRLGRTTGEQFATSSEFIVYGSSNNYSILDIKLGNPTSENPQDLYLRLGNGVVYTGFNVGIGTDNPVNGKCEINGSVTKNLSARYYASNGTNGPATTDRPLSIYASRHIACEELQVFSDERIKCNIEDINDSSALEILRLIKPKKYNYIDIVKKGTQPVFGFIAQEVKDVLEHSITLINEFIPNIYCRANVTQTNSGYLFTLINGNTNLIYNNLSEIKIKIFYGENDFEKIIKITEILNENSFITQDIIENDITDVFVYGQQIEDFHSLNKNAIYTIAVAALQEVDRQLENEKQQHLQTKQRLDVLETFIKSKFPGEI